MTFENMSNYYYNQGLSLANNSDITGALKEFSKAFEFNNKNWLCCNAMGLCFYKLGKFKEAKNIWEKSIDINNIDENSAVEYLSAMEENDFKEICETYNKACAFVENKDYKKALNILTNGNFDKEQIVLIQNFYGLCNYAKGNKNKAIKAWRRVLEIDRNNEQALKYLSEVYKVKDIRSGSVDYFKNIFKKFK